MVVMKSPKTIGMILIRYALIYGSLSYPITYNYHKLLFLSYILQKYKFIVVIFGINILILEGWLLFD